MKVLVSLFSLIAILMVALPGPLYKFEIMSLGVAFTTMRWGVYVGIAALVLILIQLIFARKSMSWLGTGIAFVFAIVAVAFPLSMMMKGKSVPAIHDISTDLSTPPQFEAIVPLRIDAPNPSEYAGPETAVEQRRAYPGLTTKQYSQNQNQVFDAALVSANTLGWDIVNSDKTRGIIEATDTTQWFGFKDDVVIRIRQNGQLTDVDMRSKSRVGRSDLGKNADRINTFFADLDTNLITKD